MTSEQVRLRQTPPSSDPEPTNSDHETDRTQRPRRAGWRSVVILTVVYLALALPFSLFTRALEADDENAHVQYIEYVYRHHSEPAISRANGAESHQPPLYYFIAAGWQRLLGIPAFSSGLQASSHPFTPGHLVFSHRYTASQHQDAVYIHELRLLSVLFGLGTVLVTYAAARVIAMRERAALACGLFVALLPRQLVVTGDVTSDSLLFLLCAFALLFFLLAERARTAGRPRQRRLDLLGMGCALGAATLTKISVLPIVALLLVLTVAPAVQAWWKRSESARGLASAHDRSRTSAGASFLLDGAMVVVPFLAISGWWFIRNKHLYGQFLASTKSNSYMLGFTPPRIPWSAHLIFVTFPHALFGTTWYAQPNLLLPSWMNVVLAVIAVPCLVVGAYVVIAERRRVSGELTLWSGLALVGSIVGGLAAILIVIQSGNALFLSQSLGLGTGVGDARVGFIALSAFAIVAVVGAVRLAGSVSDRVQWLGLYLWPAIFFAVDLYVVFRFLIPLGGL
jgi:hypothetical protein